MNKHGFTLIEIMIVVVLFGTLTALSLPRMRDMFESSNTRSARVALTALVAKARATAVARGCRASVHFTSGTNGTAWVTTCRLNGTGTETLGGVDPIADRFKVTLTATRDSATFAASGISFDNVATTLRVSRGTKQDSLVINEIGKVIR